MCILTNKNFMIEITGFLNFTGSIKKQKTAFTGFLTFTGIIKKNKNLNCRILDFYRYYYKKN